MNISGKSRESAEWVCVQNVMAGISFIFKSDQPVLGLSLSLVFLCMFFYFHLLWFIPHTTFYCSWFGSRWWHFELGGKTSAVRSCPWCLTNICHTSKNRVNNDASQRNSKDRTRGWGWGGRAVFSLLQWWEDCSCLLYAVFCGQVWYH